MSLINISNVHYNGPLTVSPDWQIPRPVVSLSPNTPPHQWLILQTGRPNSVLIQFYDSNGPTNERGYLTLNPDGPHSGGMEVLLKPQQGGNDLQLWSLYQVAPDLYKFCSTQLQGLCLTAGPTPSPMIPVSAVPDGEESSRNEWRVKAA